MAEPNPDSQAASSQPKDSSAAFPEQASYPTSNVHVVSPDHLAADVDRGHRKRRRLTALLVMLGLVFVVVFAALGWWYYKVVYSAPKVFATECFELSLPVNYTKQTGLADQVVEQQKTEDYCVIDQAKQGSGGVIASATKKPADTKLSSQEYTSKINAMFEKVINQMISGKGSQISSEAASLGGAAARKIVTEQDIGDKQKVVMSHYFGVRNGKFFMIGWFYNPIDKAAKSDIEKSIESFSWK